MEIKLKDPGSAITHFIAFVGASSCAMPLIFRAVTNSGVISAVACTVFIVSMMLLYAASTVYHTFDISEKVNRILKKIDHMMISVMIAGSYTPVCLLVLDRKVGIPLLSIVWGIAILGIVIKSFWVFCPRWFSSALYIGMGWACVAAMRPLWQALSFQAFAWLLIGGVLYTIGGVVYALKLKLFNEKHIFLNSHVIFHLFVMAGSMCHFIFVFCYVA